MVSNIKVFAAPSWKRIVEYDREKERKLVGFSWSSMLG